MIKLLVFDLDNTILNSKKLLSDFSKNTLVSCVKSNYGLAFSTARSLPDIVPFTKELSLCAIISCGGSKIQIGKQILPTEPIDSTISMHLLKALTSTNRVKDLKIVTSKEITNVKNSPFLESIIPPIFKITVTLNDRTYFYELKEEYPSCAMFMYSDSCAFMITSSESTKCTALRKVLDFLSLGKEDVIAFGDDESDLDMLMSVGTSVVVSNGKKNVKDIATHICKDNDSDGVACWIRSNLL